MRKKPNITNYWNFPFHVCVSGCGAGTGVWRSKGEVHHGAGMACATGEACYWEATCESPPADWTTSTGRPLSVSLKLFLILNSPVIKQTYLQSWPTGYLSWKSKFLLSFIGIKPFKLSCLGLPDPPIRGFFSPKWMLFLPIVLLKFPNLAIMCTSLCTAEKEHIVRKHRPTCVVCCSLSNESVIQPISVFNEAVCAICCY